jgi:DNA-binding PadR family transcriptional regulator
MGDPGEVLREDRAMSDASPETFLPLSAPVYGVLLTLGERAMHGYGIIVEFEARTGQEGALLPGSLYNTLSRMLAQGLVEEVPRPERDGDPRKRYYRATDLGRSVARAESERLRALLRLAEERNLGGQPSTA